jgi:hypothetical protein
VAVQIMAIIVGQASKKRKKKEKLLGWD